MKTTDEIIKYASAKQVISALKTENAELKSIVESLKIANAEKDRELSKLIDEALLYGCGGTA